MDETTGVSRREAIKKAVIAGGAIGAVWSAPKVQGLTLRPNYASAGTNSVTAPWALDLGGVTSTSFSGNFAGPSAVSGIGQMFVRVRPAATGFTGRARVVVNGNTLVTRACSVRFNSAAGVSVGANILSVTSSSQIQHTNSLPNFTTLAPARAAGDVTCNCV